ncbi:conserved hypothetical protein [Culex quinquefasciatus]|uniref:Uncharacterized protein n=1 Tax=Culex quinquefasciatus TaxID=7176 RepID=B0WHB5_CULQU|nr:conserved hypothetical protein [Culex quinquefasciatus]|eukprot:XP_001848099.1 conserved hypothetical protein [Culex quinquefasciatus]
MWIRIRVKMSLLIFALLVLLTVDGGSRLMAHSAAEDELNVEVEGEDASMTGQAEETDD